MSEERAGTVSRWVVIPSLISFLYGLGVVLIALLHTGPVGLPQQLLAMPLNELGDFLAGVFAPLAFLWLVAAVGIQAQELAAQRGELALTRLEMEAARMVSVEQAEQARQQAKSLHAQATLLQAQANLTREKEADLAFASAVASFMRWARATFTEKARKFPVERCWADGLPDDDILAFGALSEKMQMVVWRASEKGNLAELRLLPKREGIEWVYRLREIGELESRLSKKKKAILARCKVDQFAEAIIALSDIQNLMDGVRANETRSEEPAREREHQS